MLMNMYNVYYIPLEQAQQLNAINAIIENNLNAAWYEEKIKLRSNIYTILIVN